MASDRHCLASVEKGSPNHDGVMVGRTDTANSDGRGWGCMGVCVFASVCTCVYACVRDVFAIYDNDILPMLIIYIIIRHCSGVGAFPRPFCVPNSVALASLTLQVGDWAIH